MKFSRLFAIALSCALLVSLMGCTAQQLAALNPPASIPATQPSGTAAPSALATGVNEVHDVASNPAVQAAASAIPYGSLAVAGIVLVTGILGHIIGNNAGQQTGVLATLKSAANTDTIEDAAAVAHAAIAAQPKIAGSAAATALGELGSVVAGELAGKATG